MKVDTLTNSVALKQYPDILVIHSGNVTCYEQCSFFGVERTFVFIANSKNGYVAVGKRVQGREYLTLYRWAIEPAQGVSFSVPVPWSFSIECVSYRAMTKRYQSEKHLWATLSKGTRYDAVMPLTRGNTA